MSKLTAILGKVRGFLNSTTGQVIKLLVSITIICGLVYFIDWLKFWEILEKIDLKWIPVILFLVLFRNFISGFRFKILCSSIKKLSTWLLTKHYFIGSMFNLFLPTSIGGDGVRVALLSQESSIPVKDGTALVLLERFIGFFGFILFSLFSCFFISISPAIQLAVVGMSVVYFVLFVTMLKAPDFGQNLPVIGSLISSYNKLRKERKLIVYAFGVSIVFQFVSILMRYLIAYSVGIEVSFLSFLVFIPLINIVTLLPISLGGHGLREGAFLFFFSQVGLTKEEAWIISLGSLLIFTITALVGAVIYFYERVLVKGSNTLITKNENEQ